MAQTWITLKVTPEVKQKIRLLAAKESCTLNEAIDQAITDRLTRRPRCPSTP